MRADPTASALFVVLVVALALALTACGDSTSSAPNVPSPTANANQIANPSGQRDTGLGTGPMSIGGAQWAEGKALAAALVRNIKTQSMGGVPDAIQVGATADQFCPGLGIPVPKGKWFSGADFRVSEVNHSGRTFTISVTKGPNTMTIDQNARMTGP